MADFSSDTDNDDDYIELHNETASNSDLINAHTGLHCLFCTDQSSVDADHLINSHFRTVHGIESFSSFLATHGLCSQSDWVRFVTFVRRRELKNLPSNSCESPKQILEEFKRTEDAPVNGAGDTEMPPSSPPIDDPLMYEIDIEELIQDSMVASIGARQHAQQTNDISVKDRRIMELEQQVESLKSQIFGMSAVLRRFAVGADGGAADSAAAAATPAAVEQGKPSVQQQRTIADLNDDEDDYYVDSYSGDSIHAEMLQDRVRTGAYHDFMLDNPSLFAGRTVIDVGCGTGILSMFAVQAGAANVLAIDCAEVLSRAKEAAAENGLLDRISFHRGKLEQIKELRGVQADAIVSEWMGYCLLYEGMLESVLYARDHFLKPGGGVYPRICNLFLCGIESEEFYQRNVLYFDYVYGVRISYLKERCLNEPHVAYDLKSEWVVTDSSLVCSIDMLTATPYASAKVESTPARLTASRDCRLHAIVAYFDVDFLGNGDAGNNIRFSTCPLSQVTHWGQTVFYLRSPISLKAGEALEFSVSIGPPEYSPRSLGVRFHWPDGSSSQFLMK